MAQPVLKPKAAPAPRPRLSILCPTYNRLRFIERFLKHHVDAFGGRDSTVEIVVSDNGSTDGSREHAREVAEAHDFVRLVEQPQNVGAYGNVLYGYRHARGTYAAYVGDDDALMAEQVLEALDWMDANPHCVMWQAPWILLDETRDDAVIGQFYHFDQPRLFRPGEHGRCLDFVLAHHVFPESYILRTDAIPRIISPLHEHAFVFFTQLSRALDVGSVLFSPKPFARMTAVHKGENVHAGNTEAMMGWDRYRGGLEYMAARARTGDASALGDMPTFLIRMQQFVCQRMTVAVNLHRAARNWRDVHYLTRRLAAYGVAMPPTPDLEHLHALAALQTCFAEARMLKREIVVLDPKVPEMFVENLAKGSLLPIERPGAVAEDGRARAHVVLGGRPDWPIADSDIVIDLQAAIEQYA